MKSPGHRANILEIGVPRDRHRLRVRRARAAGRAAPGGHIHHDLRRRRAVTARHPAARVAIPVGDARSDRPVAPVRRHRRPRPPVLQRRARDSSSASWGRTGPARPRRCGSSSGCSSPTAARSAGAGSPVDLETRARFGYMPEERGLYPKMRVHDQLAYFAALHGLPRRRGGRGRHGLARAARDRRPRGRPRRVAVARQPAARAARRGARPRPGAARARRAVLRPRPGRRRRAERRAARARRRGRAGGVLLAPARARRAPVRVRGDRQGRAARGRRARVEELREQGAGGQTVRVAVAGTGRGRTRRSRTARSTPCCRRAGSTRRRSPTRRCSGSSRPPAARCSRPRR